MASSGARSETVSPPAQMTPLHTLAHTSPTDLVSGQCVGHPADRFLNGFPPNNEFPDLKGG